MLLKETLGFCGLISRNLTRSGVGCCYVSACSYSVHARKNKRSSSWKRGKHLESPLKPTVFSFGNFSRLEKPKEKLRDISENLVKSFTTFESLRIFPTVRLAMKEEIKAHYNLKNSRVTSKDDLELKPTPVQVAAIRKINQRRAAVDKANIGDKLASKMIFAELARENEANRLKVFTIAAETGSGKTWAYLASVLSKLKEDDLAAYSRSAASYQKLLSEQGIRSLILLPTHELVDQVYDCVSYASRASYDLNEISASGIPKDKNLAQFLQNNENKSCLNFNVFKWSTGDSHDKLFNACRNRIDVLVTTPSKINSLGNLVNIERPFNYFGNVKYCVIDEADTLMDKSWLVDTTSVVRRIPRCKDLIFCSATIPREFNKTMEKMFPDKHTLIPIVTPSLHKIPRQINLKIIDAQLPPYNGSKVRCLAQAIYAIHKDGTEHGYVKRILVFVNEKKDVQPLVDTLVTRFGHRHEDILGVTGRNSPEERAKIIEPFINPATRLEDDSDSSKIKVLITTDLLARGLNFSGIKNVILMDLPNTSVDLVHRIGRTGRMRQSGRVFVLIDKKTGKSWVKGLPKIVKSGVPLG